MARREHFIPIEHDICVHPAQRDSDQPLRGAPQRARQLDEAPPPLHNTSPGRRSARNSVSECHSGATGDRHPQHRYRRHREILTSAGRKTAWGHYGSYELFSGLSAEPRGVMVLKLTEARILSLPSRSSAVTPTPSLAAHTRTGVWRKAALRLVPQLRSRHLWRPHLRRGEAEPACLFFL